MKNPLAKVVPKLGILGNQRRVVLASRGLVVGHVKGVTNFLYCARASGMRLKRFQSSRTNRGKKHSFEKLGLSVSGNIQDFEEVLRKNRDFKI